MNSDDFNPGYILAKGAEPRADWRGGAVACARCGAEILPRDDCMGRPPHVVCMACHRTAEQVVEEGMVIYHQVRDRLAVRDVILEALRERHMWEAARVTMDAYEAAYRSTEHG